MDTIFDDRDDEEPREPLNWGMQLPDDPGALEELRQKNLFLEKMIQGYGALNAGMAIGWSPDKVRRIQADPLMAELISVIDERMDENVKMAVYRTAVAGNATAQAMWLYNRKPGEWKDVKRIQIERHETVSLEIVHSVKQSAIELLREQGVRALQPGGALDAIEAAVLEDD